jgi:hypothetical protein
MAEPARGRVLPWLLETALAVLAAAAVHLVWPQVAAPRLGHEEIWFALGWLLLLAGPAGLRLAGGFRPQPSPLSYTFEAESLGHYAFGLAGLFVALLLAAPQLGNYKLWLGAVYLAGLTLRLAGLALFLRRSMLAHQRGGWPAALAGAAIAAFAGLLLIPWLLPRVTAAWPPPWGALAGPAAAALLWGGISGAVLWGVQLWGGSRRGAWLAFLALALGPGPALAVSWIPLAYLAGGLAGLAGLCLVRVLAPAPGRAEGAGGPPPMSLYWLLRALLLFWWGVGAALTLAAAWWQPRLGDLFVSSIWLRALLLGGFVVACVGLLAEYTLPLIGRFARMSPGAERKLPGVVLSALALLFALASLVLTDPYESPAAPGGLLEEGRAELLGAPVVLNPENPEVDLTPPRWLTGLSRVFVVSKLAGAAQVGQGKPVAQLVAVDHEGLPHIFHLRAGIDTAEWALNKREVAEEAQHGPARVASTWIVYTPEGEAFTAQSYFTGLYLGSQLHSLQSVKLRYIYENPPGRPAAEVQVRRVFLN